MSRRISMLVTLAAAMLGTGIAVAHPHKTHNGQVIANGQNHPPFTLVAGEDDSQDSFLIQSCDTAGTAGPAWYGLETAHHGPDMGTKGKGDGCFVTMGKKNPNFPASGPKYVPLPSTNPGFGS